MKIFMYSDLHISKTSSILPLSSVNPKYTYRQNMIIKLGQYLADVIDQEKPDLIVNLGDTFDQHTITSYDVDVASEFFNCFKYLNIPHVVLVGNHEMINADFNAIQILNNIDNITVITEPCTVDSKILLAEYNKDIDENYEYPKLAFMPYREFRDIVEFPDGDFLFSHLDIKGMSVRSGYDLEDGVSTDTLTKYKLVFNGHIHKPSIKGNIVNVGSISTHSFSDDDSSVPQCYVFNTDSLNLVTYKPNTCPLFRKFSINNNLTELSTYADSLDKNYRYILQISCPFDLKEDVKSFIEQHPFILASRLNVRVDNSKKSDDSMNATVQSNVDIVKSFKEFLSTTDLKYAEQLYLDVIGGIK